MVVRGSRQLLGLFSVEGISVLGAGMVWVTLIVFIERILHGGTLEYGWWLSLNALGGLFGSATAGFLARRLLACVLISSGLIGIGLAWMALVLLASLPAPSQCCSVLAWQVCWVDVSIRASSSGWPASWISWPD